MLFIDYRNFSTTGRGRNYYFMGRGVGRNRGADLIIGISHLHLEMEIGSADLNILFSYLKIVAKVKYCQN